MDKSILEIHKIPNLNLQQSIKKIKNKLNLSREKI